MTQYVLMALLVIYIMSFVGAEVCRYQQRTNNERSFFDAYAFIYFPDAA